MPYHPIIGIPFPWNIYLEVHEFLLGISLIAHGLYLIFAEFKWEQFKISGYIALSGAIVFVCQTGINEGLRRICNAWEVQVQKRIKFQQFLGLFLMLLCGVVPRVLIYFVKWNFYQTYSILFLFLMLVSIIHYEAYQSGQYSFYYFDDILITFVVVTLNFAVLVGSIRFAITFPDPWDMGAIIFTQASCAPLCFLATLDLTMMLIGKMEITAQNPAPQPQPIQLNQVAPAPAPAQDAPPAVNAAPVHRQVAVELDGIEKSSFDCRGCSKEFSKDKLPKNLIYCDHTICQQCLQANYQKQDEKYVVCPICRQVTAVKGGIAKLSTNMALLDVIEEIKHKD